MTHRFLARLFQLLTIVLLLGFYPNTMETAHSASDLSSVRKENEPNKPVQIVNMAVSPNPTVSQHSTLTSTSTPTAVPTPTTLTIQISQGSDDASNSP